MKTPEEMAEEYCNTKQLSYVERLVITKGFVDGYQAAKDQLADAGKVMDTCEHILDMEKMVDVNCSNNSDGWISVMKRLPNRLPEPDNESGIPMLVLISGDGWHSHEVAAFGPTVWKDKYGDLVENVTHWMPLPEAPKGEE